MPGAVRPQPLHSSSPRMAIFGYLGLRPSRFCYLPVPEVCRPHDFHPIAEDSESDRRRRLEAVLFLSPQGVTSRKASKLAALADATEVRTLIRRLNQIYDCQLRPYRIEEVAGGYAIVTRGRLSAWLRKLSYLPGEVQLGRTALETLAIVAYRQPIMRADIEAIRGVGSSEVLKQLMEMDLVRICGRSEDLGRPYLYGTTLRFLQMFGLRSPDRLPRIEWVNFKSPVDTITPSSEDFAFDSEAKESTVKSTITTANFMGEEIVDELLLATTATVIPISAIDEDDDEDWEDDEEDEEDDDDDVDDFEDEAEDDEDLDDWEDEEEDVGEEEEVAGEAEEELEEEEEEEEEEEVWEEVDDEEEGDDLDEDEDDDDWDDDEDDDWEDDDEEEEDWE